MREMYTSIFCVHSLDDSTGFLDAFKDVLPDHYTVIEANDDSLEEALEKLKALKPTSLIIFLGHGHSRCIYSPESGSYEKKIFVDVKAANELFRGHDLILLSCKSADFINSLSTYNMAIGFGNIISSVAESGAEAEYTGRFRDLTDEDIQYFNRAYVSAISKCVKLLMEKLISFKELAKQISFYINQEIIVVLKQKDKSNRVELARLLFEFRNELLLKKA